MLNLSTASIIEKNKVSTDGVWLLMLEIRYDGEEALRLVNNTENIVYQGNTYYAFPFTLDDITENNNELPTAKLQVSNVTGTIQRMVEAHNGYTGAEVIIRVVNSKIPDVAEVEESFVIMGTEATAQWMTFTLGSEFSFTRRFPLVRMMKDYCPFKFKSPQCGYTGREMQCNKTLSRCRELRNSVRFGGEPTIPQGGVYVK